MASSPYSEWQAEAAMGARLMAGFDDQRRDLPCIAGLNGEFDLLAIYRKRNPGVTPS